MPKVYKYWSDLDPSSLFDTRKERDEYDAQLRVQQFKERTEAKQAADAEGGETFRNLTAPGALPPQGGVGMPQEQADLSRKPVSLPDPSTFARGTQYGETKAGSAYWDELAMEGIKKGVNQYADTHETDKNKQVMDFLRMGTETDLLDADDVKKIIAKYSLGSEGAGGGLGKSPSAVELRYTQDHPEEVESFKEMVDGLSDWKDNQGNPMFKGEELTNLKELSTGKLWSARSKFAQLVNPATRDKYKLETTIPAKVETARKVKKATVETDILTKSGLSDVSAKTSGAIEGGKITGKRDAGITIPAGTAERLGDFNASLGQLGILAKAMADPNSPQGPIAQMRKANPYDWKAQAKQQMVATTKQLVGKALEGGVLRAEDERKYEKILPKMGDTYKTAAEKSKNLFEMIDNKYQETLKGLKKSGYYIDNFQTEGETTEKPVNLSDEEWEELQELEQEFGK